MLSSTSTRREARSYLQRFQPSLAANTGAETGTGTSAPADPPAPAPALLKYLKQSSFTQADIKARNQTYVQRLLQNHPPPALSQLPISAGTFFVPEIAEEDIHVGLVKIRGVASIDDLTLNGIGRTLSQLNRLGLFSVVIVDELPPLPETDPAGLTAWRALMHVQADRVVSAIEDGRGCARRVDGCVTVAGETSETAPEITLPNLLITPLSRGVIPVLLPIAYNQAQCAVPTTANAVVLALTALLSAHSPYESSAPPVEQPIVLDRLIFLDPLGGIPSHDRPSGAHVFINMEQEYPSLCAQLLSAQTGGGGDAAGDGDGGIADHHHHFANLRTLRTALSLLPPTSSALITTPSLAAAYANQPSASASLQPHPRPHARPPGPKNPLIHNLLTDKPLISSSLPVDSSSYQGTLTTLLKHGIPLTVHRNTALTSPLIDLPKLTALIEDSFGKTLDTAHYLARINDRVAAVIVAGDYEGAAIITWEHPTLSSARRVCYLDKFAVLKRSQGAGGVADVVFKSMVDGVNAGMFPGAEGVVWRSRRWNPVNKWVSSGFYLSIYLSIYLFPVLLSPCFFVLFYPGEEMLMGGRDSILSAQRARTRSRAQIGPCSGPLLMHRFAEAGSSTTSTCAAGSSRA